jgi:tryptophanyl-tRNA synthetase
MNIKDIELKFKDSNYGEFKKALADIVVTFLEDIQAKHNYLLNNKDLEEVLDRGSKEVNEMARLKYIDMRKKMGIYR